MRRHRIEIQRRVSERNSVGEVVYSFEKSCETWAEIHDDVITIRYQADLMPGYRVIVGNETFEIVSVRDILQPTRLVELGIRACAELPHARPRWTASEGFLGRMVNTAKSGEPP